MEWHSTGITIVMASQYPVLTTSATRCSVRGTHIRSDTHLRESRLPVTPVPVCNELRPTVLNEARKSNSTWFDLLGLLEAPKMAGNALYILCRSPSLNVAASAATATSPMPRSSPPTLTRAASKANSLRHPVPVRQLRLSHDEFETAETAKGGSHGCVRPRQGGQGVMLVTQSPS